MCAVIYLLCINVSLSTSMQGSKLNFSKKCILGTFTCKMVAIKNPSPPQASLEWNCGWFVNVSGKVQVMFKLEMETMFSSAQNKKLNKYDIDHSDSLGISSNHKRN